MGHGNIMLVELKKYSDAGVRPDVIRLFGLMTNRVHIRKKELGCEVFYNDKSLGVYHHYEGFLEFWEARHNGLLVGRTLRYHEENEYPG